MAQEILKNCLITRTRQISRVLTAVYDEALRPFGINAPQLTLLVLVHELGPISRAELGRRNHHDRSTMTRNLRPLLAQGWVSEGFPEEDGRSRPLCITRAGMSLLGRIGPAWARAQAAAKSLVGQDGADAIMQIASTLTRRGQGASRGPTIR
ncbi:MarR family transcriptional regulator [Cupriavidus sp. U2]|uniref:MarR family winged helix-turn-helix transcriptional regulator n=1 Tax=Cupriavidus sp. U2 TaxID=2920269 RepID=UPI001E3760CE|nr:MarR family transcriptional regulator [Cupriavidus sp. U2]